MADGDTMNKKIVKLLIFVGVIYFVSYSWFSLRGTYMPKSLKAQIINGQPTLVSKKKGLVWVPKYPEQFSDFCFIIYVPLHYLDKFLVHREK